MIIPPIKTQGIKTKLVPFIKENISINSETLWIEPFFGSGVVGFNLAPQNAIFSDLNPHIINFYNALKTGEIDDQYVRCFLTEEGSKLENIGEDYYYEVRERFNEKKQPLDFLFLNRACFNGMIRFNKKGKFNVPFCKKANRFSKSYITKIVNQVKNVEILLTFNNWEFINLDGITLIKKYSNNENCFIYCDPPYIGRHTDYFDSWDETDEFNLFKALEESNCKFMLSTWDHNKYRENEYLKSLWRRYRKINKEHFYFVGGKEKNRNSMIEALVVNY